MKHWIRLFLISTLLFSINQQSFSQQEENDTIMDIIEIMPEYPGGEEARMKFIVENIEYPEIAREQNVQGTVYVSFIVEKDGSLTNIKILRGIGSACDKEVIRIVNKMPNWKAGTQRGKAVRVKFNMPVKFQLKNRTKKKQQRRK